MKKEKKLIRRAKQGKPIQQVATLPYRISECGELEILLLTSRGTGRFVVPKGWPEKKLRDWDAAAREAAQEAGVKGRLSNTPIGRYRYFKRLNENFVPVDVDVYPLLVEQTLEKWKERRQRKRAWVKPDQAALLVDEPELISLIAGMCRAAPGV